MIVNGGGFNSDRGGTYCSGSRARFLREPFPVLVPGLWSGVTTGRWAPRVPEIWSGLFQESREVTTWRACAWIAMDYEGVSALRAPCAHATTEWASFGLRALRLA